MRHRFFDRRAAAAIVLVAAAPAPLAWATAAGSHHGWVAYLAALGTVLMTVAAAFNLRRQPLEGRGAPAATGLVSAVSVPRDPPEAITFVWEEGVRVIKQQLDHGDAVDQKTGLLIALLAPTMALIATQGTVLGEFSGLLALQLLVAATYLLISFWVRGYDAPPRIEALVPLAKATPDQIRARLIANLVTAQNHNRATIDSKVLFLKAAFVSLGVFLVTVFAALPHLIEKGG